MYYLIYNSLLWFLALTVLPLYYIYGWLSKKHGASLRARFCPEQRLAVANSAHPRIWLHAASVGEVQVARSLIAELKIAVPEAVIILSTVTEQGQRVAREQLRDTAFCIYAPLDLTITVDKFLQALRPEIYVCLETELWPNIIRGLQRKNIPLVLLNGRISTGSFKKYSKIKGFTKEILAAFSVIATIQTGDAERFISLGADPDRVVVLGNAKYDQAEDTSAAKVLRDGYRRRLGMEENQPVLIAGSTHGGEEQMMIAAYKQLQGTIANLLLVIAPRHLNRVAAVVALLSAEKIDFVLFSQLGGQPRTAGVVVVDTMGELASLYALATYVFCGGSLVERGGHNIMEAARWGKPVFYGPHMKDFADAKELLEAEQAGFPIRHPGEMVTAILALHANQDAYQTVCQRVLRAAQAPRRSAARQVRLLLGYLPGRPGEPATITEN